MNKFNILLLSFLLTACGNSTTEPKEQQEFKSLISSLSNEYKTAKNSDNDLEIKDFENKFKKELKDTNRAVSSWVNEMTQNSEHYCVTWLACFDFEIKVIARIP